MNSEIFYTLIYLWIGLAPLVLIILFFVNAPYGRYVRPGWGAILSNRLGWFLMEAPSFLIMVILFWKFKSKINFILTISFILWEAHYLYRTIVFPLLLPKVLKKFSLIVVLFGISFNIINSIFNGLDLFYFKIPQSLITTKFILGTIIFLFGFFIHVWSDIILINLKKYTDLSSYKIPNKGLFKWISCPNYFGEIIEWLGWWIMTSSIAALSFVIWTISNLLPRAISHHKWYKVNFLDYPKERKALIPFLL